MTKVNQIAWLKAPGEPLVVEETTIPEPATNEIVIENKAVAINPIDYIVADTGILVRKSPVNLGMDVAGVVVSVGQDAAKRFKRGDRVIALCETVFSPGQERGGFQNYPVVTDLVVAHLPEHVSFIDGSTFPLGMFTAAAGLFHREYLNLDFPEVPSKSQNGKTLFVWGGAASVGACAIQLAVAAGYRVVATASEKNFDLVRSLGAAEVLDYRKSSVVEDAISVLTGTEFAGTFLAAGGYDSVKQATDITKATPGTQHFVGAPLCPEGFTADIKLGWIDLGVANYSEEMRRVASHVYSKFLPQALEKKALKVVPPARVVAKGVNGFQKALEIKAAGGPAEKLVVEL